MATADAVWEERDTSPGAIESALRRLEGECHATGDGYVPARALNLVCVVDRAYSGEIANRLRQVGRYHGSRTVVCAVDPRRETIDARVSMAFEADPQAGHTVEIRETVVLDVGERHLPALHTIVDALVITDVPTVAWAPHGHPVAIDALTAGGGGAQSGGARSATGMAIAQVVLLDSADGEGTVEALARLTELTAAVSVVDLAWLRCNAWRVRLASAFDPAPRRRELTELAKVSVRHRADSEVSGLMLLGWLAARLGWRPERLSRQGAVLQGRARDAAGRHEIELRMEAVDDLGVPGLAGVEVTTARGAQLALERGAGGLTARRREAGRGGSPGEERTWTVLGASRGEGGILGEGIRQALMRDPVHEPALRAATAMMAR